MPNASAEPPVRIHPTAVISPEAELADDVRVGPHAVIEGRVRIGPGCVLGPHTYLVGPLTMGHDNIVHAGVVLGDRPQHLRYNEEPTGLEIGDHNIFREHVTVHRATSQSWTTRIGSHNFFMVNAHVAHDCQVGSRCIFANGALLGGHCLIEDYVYLSGNCAVHQFMRIGRMALLSGCSTTTKDIPPFMIQNGINTVVGVNVVGMRRAGMTPEEIQQVRLAYRLLYREALALPTALARIEQELGASDAVAELLLFIRSSTRGIILRSDRDREAA